MNASRSARAPGVPTVLLRTVRSSDALGLLAQLVQLDVETADVGLLDRELLLDLALGDRLARIREPRQ